MESEIMESDLIYNKNGIKIFREILPPLEVNTYIIIYKNTIIIVDPGIGINEKLNEIDGYNYEYKGVILTHFHYDHIAGLKELKDFQVMISQKDKPGLKDKSLNLSFMFEENFDVKLNVEELYEGYYNYGDLKFLIKYFPGHTPGSVICDFGEVIFTGDFIFFNTIGRTDLPLGDNGEMLNSLKNFKKYIEGKDDHILVLPGHMGISNLKELKEKNTILKYGGKL